MDFVLPLGNSDYLLDLAQDQEKERKAFADRKKIEEEELNKKLEGDKKAQQDREKKELEDRQAKERKDLEVKQQKESGK